MFQIEMTQAEALQIADYVAQRRGICKRAIEAVNRKRSWQPSIKAMAVAGYMKELETLQLIDNLRVFTKSED